MATRVAASSASVEQLIRSYSPQLAVLAKAPPTGPGWAHELKLDGYRAGGILVRGAARLVSRRGNDITGEFPEVAEALGRLRAHEALVDGEIVVLDAHGRTDFSALQNRATSRQGLAYFLFDLLFLDGEDVSGRPLFERKKLLKELIPANDERLRFSPHFEVDGRQMFQNACRLGAEGVVSKRLTARYQRGARTATWVKSRCQLRQEFVVGGFTDPTDVSSGLVGSLLIGHYEDGRLVWAGKVSRGHGFTRKFLLELRAKLNALEQKQSPFDPKPPGWLGRNAHWVRPQLVVEVSFSEWTKSGQLRHPTVEGFRDDKTPPEVRREEPVHNPIAFPRAKLSRTDLLEFHESVSRWSLPHLLGRPLTLVRCPRSVSEDDALRSQCEFIKHTAAFNRWAPPVVPRVNVRELKKIGEYLYVDGLPALLALVAGGIIELHAWNATVADLERPDRIVLDLDPGDDVPWDDVIEAAHLVRARLKAVGLECWPKTTGGKGLHLHVPFERELGWDDVFAFSRVFAESLAARERGFTTSFNKADRPGRILIDYKRNYRTSIAIAAFSPRARPHAPVAVPVSWREVTPRLRPDAWTVRNLGKRLARLRTDPWAGYWTAKQRLTGVLKKQRH